MKLSPRLLGVAVLTAIGAFAESGTPLHWGSPRSRCAATFHATPGYPLTAVAGLTFRLRGK